MTTFKCMKSLLVHFLATHVGLQGSAMASVKSVWAVNDGEKVEREDLQNPNKQTNSAWDG